MKRKWVALLVVFSLFSFNHLIPRADAASTFTDVKDSDWFSDSIEWALNQKIITGFPDKSFRPNAGVTEKQFLTMLARVNKVTGDPYEDVRDRNMPIYYKLNMPLTRFDTALYLSANMGYLKSDDIVNGAVQYLFDKGIAKGVSAEDQSMENFKGSLILTRAEAVTFIKRAVESSLSLGQKLSSKPEITYPKSVLINGMNTDSFAEIVSHLPEIEDKFDKMDKAVYDNNLHVVDLYENQYNGADSVGFFIHKSPERNQVDIYIRYDSELVRNAALAVLKLYVSNEESKDILDKYLQYLSSKNTQTVDYPTKSEYEISFSSYQIEINWSGEE